jgi:AP-4 complex subunit beta-1
VPASVDTVTQICIQLVDYGIPQIADLTLICLRGATRACSSAQNKRFANLTADILRKYPELSEQIIPELQKCFGVVSSSEGKAALIWMVGEYGDRIEESPYLLEDLVDGWSDEDPAVRLQLLSASAKLFFKRPGEMQPTIISVLEKGVDDDANPDVHDRALFLTRLIGRDANLAKSIIDNLQGTPTHATSLVPEYL